MYNEYFLEGYYDALNEASSTEVIQAHNRAKAGVSKSDIDDAKKTVTAFGVGGAVGGAAGAAAGTALAVRQGKKIANYSTRLGELKKKKDSGKITPQELKEYKKLIAKTALRGAIGVGSAKYAVGSAARGATIAGSAHKLNKKVKRTFGESYEEAFLEGYYDALNEASHSKAAASLALGGLGTAAGASIAAKQYNRMKDYSKRLEELKKKKKSGKITALELDEYKKLIAKSIARGTVGSLATGLAVSSAVNGIHNAKAYNENYMDAFLEGYMDVLTEI